MTPAWLAALGLGLDARGCRPKPVELACPNHLPHQRVATHSERHLLEGCGDAAQPDIRCQFPEGLLLLCCSSISAYGVVSPAAASSGDGAAVLSLALASAAAPPAAAEDVGGLPGLPPTLRPVPLSSPSPPPLWHTMQPPALQPSEPDAAPQHGRRLNKPPSTPPSAPLASAPVGNSARLLNSTLAAAPPAPPLWAPLTAPVPGSLVPALATIAIQVDIGFAIVALALAIACAGASHVLGRALKEWCRRGTGADARASRRRVEAQARLREAHIALSASSTAVPDWQRAVVAIGARPAGGGAPTLVGSGFVVHLPSNGPPILSHAGGEHLRDAIPAGREAGALVCTCAHVLDDIRLHAKRRGDSGAPGPDGSAVASGTRGALLDPYLESVAIGWGSPVVWRYAAVVRRVSPPPAPRDSRNGLDLALLELLHPIPHTPTPSSSLSSGKASPSQPSRSSPSQPIQAIPVQPGTAGLPGQASPPVPSYPPPPWPAALCPLAPLRSQCRAAASFEDMEGGAASQEEDGLMALPLGDDLRLRLGDDLFLLGYSRTARNQPPSATNTRGVFAGRWDDDATGQWLRTDALMLGGHSGGPLINCVGEVVGWSVRSNFDPVVQGAGFYAAGLNEVRPVRALKAELQALLGPDALLEGSVRCRLTGPAAAREAMRAVEAALSLHATSSDDEDRLPLRMPRRFPRRLYSSAAPSSPGAAVVLRIKGSGDARPRLDWRAAPSALPLRTRPPLAAARSGSSLLDAATLQSHTAMPAVRDETQPATPRTRRAPPGRAYRV